MSLKPLPIYLMLCDARDAANSSDDESECPFCLAASEVADVYEDFVGYFPCTEWCILSRCLRWDRIVSCEQFGKNCLHIIENSDR